MRMQALLEQARALTEEANTSEMAKDVERLMKSVRRISPLWKALHDAAFHLKAGDKEDAIFHLERARDHAAGMDQKTWNVIGPAPLINKTPDEVGRQIHGMLQKLK